MKKMHLICAAQQRDQELTRLKLYESGIEQARRATGWARGPVRLATNTHGLALGGAHVQAHMMVDKKL